MNNKEIIKTLLLQKLNKQGWKNNEFIYELFPYDNKSSIKFRYLKFKFKRERKLFSCDLTIENHDYCILTVEESDREIKSSNDDFIYFTFKIKPEKNITKCIETAVSHLTEIKLCESCQRIFHKDDLDQFNCCLTCNIQSIFEKRDFCAICHDGDNVKLMHKLPCEHEFHFSCLTKLRKKECPLCRNCFSLRRR
jgi:hypothetical protein